MKLLNLILVCSMMLGGIAFAQQPKDSAAQQSKEQTADATLNAITGTEKKSRKKKVEMCPECGKPETECECPEDGKHPPTHKNKKEEKKKE